MNHVPSTQLLLIEREKEVAGYVEFLLVAADRPSVISANGGEVHLSLSLDLIHTLKSNLLLLLYSAMEATLVQLLDEMHGAIDTYCDSADRLNSELLRLVLKTFQKDAKGQALNTNSPLHQGLFRYWIQDWQGKTSAKDKRSDGISGSVDGLVFYKQLRKFGVVAKTQDDKAPNHLTHNALQRIKNNRNALAHGETSFTDLGRQLSVQELEADAGAVFTTLKQIATEVNNYLEGRRYLATPLA
ncbi:MAG: hypothetical protein IV104_20730 [Acidovorax sp.]|nr:hypothetical protein [Acidovorax sp.]